jgi:hypothetical protein
LQRRDAFAFEVSLSRSGEDRLGSKTVLNPKGILHDPSQPVVLNFCHASKITNESPNRKLKTGPVDGRANLPVCSNFTDSQRSDAGGTLSGTHTQEHRSARS